MKATTAVSRSRGIVRVGFQNRAASLPHGVSKEVKSKGTPLIAN